METLSKVKVWIAENAPMLQGIYQNKYVGMVYDRFGSLPPKQQKRTLVGIALGVVGFVVLMIGGSYLSLWSTSGTAKKSYAMVNMLLQYQKDRRDKGPQIQHLERNNLLASPGAFKQALLDMARGAGISPRMATIEEKSASAPEGDDAKAGNEVQAKEATISLQRVNLTQLKNFLQAVEFGSYNLIVSSVKITNDDKIRGYMKADLAVIAYLFRSDENI